MGTLSVSYEYFLPLKSKFQQVATLLSPAFSIVAGFHCHAIKN